MAENGKSFIDLYFNLYLALIFKNCTYSVSSNLLVRFKPRKKVGVTDLVSELQNIVIAGLNLPYDDL